MIEPPGTGHCNTPEDEFWYHVSPQEGLPLAPGTSERTSLDPVEDFLLDLDEDSDAYLAESVRDHLLDTPESLNGLRLLAGMSDKRLYLDLSYRLSRVPASSPNISLCGCAPNALTRHSTTFFINLLKKSPSRHKVADEISVYLVEAGLARLTVALSALTPDQRKPLVIAFAARQEAQQNEAKRRGHGAEATLARLLQNLNVRIEPVDKANNPMGAQDPHFDANTWELYDQRQEGTYSADLAIIGPGNELTACIQSLIHSSDPGQFGVNKSDETVLIRDILDSTGKGEIWGLLDGVGYSENKSGTINKLIDAFHSFAQINSLYKIALDCHRLGLVTVHGILFDDKYPAACKEPMIGRYVPSDIPVLDTLPVSPPNQFITAGWATVII